MFTDVTIIIPAEIRKQAEEALHEFLQPGYHNAWDGYQIINSRKLSLCYKAVKARCADNRILKEQAFANLRAIHYKMVSEKLTLSEGAIKFYSFQMKYWAIRFCNAQLGRFSESTSVFCLSPFGAEIVPDDPAGYFAFRVSVHW